MIIIIIIFLLRFYYIEFLFFFWSISIDINIAYTMVGLYIDFYFSHIFIIIIILCDKLVNFMF